MYALICFNAENEHQIRNSRRYEWIRLRFSKMMKENTVFRNSEYQSRWSIEQWRKVHLEIAMKNGFDNISDFARVMAQIRINNENYHEVITNTFNITDDTARTIMRNEGYPSTKIDFKIYYIAKLAEMDVDEFTTHLKSFQTTKRIPTKLLISKYPLLTKYIVKHIWSK